MEERGLLCVASVKVPTATFSSTLPQPACEVVTVSHEILLKISRIMGFYSSCWYILLFLFPLSLLINFSFKLELSRPRQSHAGYCAPLWP